MFAIITITLLAKLIHVIKSRLKVKHITQGFHPGYFRRVETARVSVSVVWEVWWHAALGGGGGGGVEGEGEGGGVGSEDTPSGKYWGIRANT